MSEVETNTAEVIETPAQFKTIVESIEKMTVLELHELVKFLEKKFGVSASAVAVAAPAGGAAAGAGRALPAGARFRSGARPRPPPARRWTARSGGGFFRGRLGAELRRRDRCPRWPPAATCR